MAIVSDPIVVVTAADEGYTMPLAVMGRSLLGSLDPGRRVHLYVIADRVAARSRRRIRASWGNGRLEVTWLVPDLDRLRHVKVDGHVRVRSEERRVGKAEGSGRSTSQGEESERT